MYYFHFFGIKGELLSDVMLKGGGKKITEIVKEIGQSLKGNETKESWKRKSKDDDMYI
jgi:hypothetical protein